MLTNKWLALYAGACITAFVASTAYADSSEVWLGYDASPRGATDQNEGYLGGMTALNKNLSTEGWLVRGDAYYGQYDTDFLSDSGTVHVDLSGGDLLIGYQLPIGNGYFNGGYFRLYAGPSYEHNQLNKSDRYAPVSGDDFGIEGLGELHLDLDNRTFADFAASYSSTFNTYWSDMRLGYNLGNFSIGPDIKFLGNESFDDQRYGFFIGDIRLGNNLTAELDGGYSNASRPGDNSGVYGDALMKVRW